MKIQMIAPFKIKILFNLQDLEENNITLHSFLSGSENTKIFLNAILEIAKEDFGLKPFKDNFTYETFSYDYHEFIVIFSIPKYINCNIISQKLFYYFFTMDNFLEFSNFVKSNITFKFKSSLYRFKDILLLEINASNLIYDDFRKLYFTLSETQDNIDLEKSNISKIVITKFKEFSEIIVQDNALNL